ncbi:type II secretion system minor pseudopilin GspK [Solimicrobium silvestre]|uniref:Type II secretion system protein K n=1 Tax=Solimicrobium silvestre TaxID=2099400 RepID=A0A2S9GYQ9_9BURK|nr:type II secretion system minor pseudopilin GspK [Solimicrobium silvestre]PRC92862.1 Type II secretory pathway component PulK [Solimicrobium silvestre]
MRRSLVTLPSAQRGVAIVTALLLAALAITLVMSLFGQQNVQVRSIENQRFQLQKQWVMRGALDWARLILREDARVNRVDYLGEPWSVPLESTRLDQYVDNGRGSEDDTDATLSGYVIDAESRLNLTNLAVAGVVDPATLLAFGSLLSGQGMDPGLATATANMVASTQAKATQFNSDGSVGAAAVSAKILALTQVDDLLAIPGFTPATVAKLRELVVFLPVATPININTASAQVISARIAGISLSDAQQIVTARNQAYYKDLTDLAARWTNSKVPIPAAGVVNTQTNYFIVHGHVQLDRSALDVDALIERTPISGATRVVWVREN